jgi:hypothetical protein
MGYVVGVCGREIERERETCTGIKCRDAPRETHISSTGNKKAGVGRERIYCLGLVAI